MVVTDAEPVNELPNYACITIENNKFQMFIEAKNVIKVSRPVV